MLPECKVFVSQKTQIKYNENPASASSLFPGCLLQRIYKDNASGRFADERYETLSAPCEYENPMPSEDGIGFGRTIVYKNTLGHLPKEGHPRCFSFWRRHPESDRGIADLQSAALPLGYGAIYAICSFRSKSLFWSGLRGSNSLPPPWQGGALPDELRPHIAFVSRRTPFGVHRDGASGRNRTNDTGIFSPLLYQLSYRGKWRLRTGSNRRPPA